MRQRCLSGDLEPERRRAGVDDRAGVHDHVAGLVQDLLEVHDRRRVVDHQAREAAGIGVAADLGRGALGGEQLDPDRVEPVRPAGGVEQEAEPEVQPDLSRRAQLVVAVRTARRCRHELEFVQRDTPEVVAERLLDLLRRPDGTLDEHLVEVRADAARVLPVDHQRQRPAERAVLHLEEVRRVDRRVGVAVREVRRVGRDEADAEQDGPGRRVHGRGEVDLLDLRCARDEQLVRRQDGDAVRRERGRARDVGVRRRRRRQVDLHHPPGRVRLRDEDHALARVRERHVTRPVQAARDHVVHVEDEVEAGDRPRVGAHVEEASVSRNEYAAGIGDGRDDSLRAVAQVDALDVAAGELADVRVTVGLVEGDLVDAVHSRGDHGRGRTIHIGEAEPKQRPGILGDIGVDTVDANSTSDGALNPVPSTVFACVCALTATISPLPASAA